MKPMALPCLILRWEAPVAVAVAVAVAVEIVMLGDFLFLSAPWIGIAAIWRFWSFCTEKKRLQPRKQLQRQKTAGKIRCRDKD